MIDIFWKLIRYQELKNEHVIMMVEYENERHGENEVSKLLSNLAYNEKLSTDVLISLYKKKEATLDWFFDNGVADSECLKVFLQYHPSYLRVLIERINFNYLKWNEGRIVMVIFEVLESLYEKGDFTYNIEKLVDRYRKIWDDMEKHEYLQRKYNDIVNKYFSGDKKKT